MKKIAFIIIVWALFLVSCESARNSESSPSLTNDSKTASTTETGGGSTRGTGRGSGSGVGRPENQVTQQISLDQAANTQTAPTASTAVERKIIRNADLELEADVPEQSQQKIAQIAESKGGFVVETQQSSSDAAAATRDTVTMTVRVPAEKFNEALGEIRQSASRVIVETVKGQDVTEEFIDIEARLKAKRALETQFLEIMKRANSVQDALDVQRQLAEVRGEIEQVEGRKRFLENQSSLSTIKIRLQTPTAFSGSSKGFFYRLSESIGSGFDAALSFVLGLVTFLIAVLPFLLLVVLPIYLVMRYFWRRVRARRPVSEIVREEIKVE